MNIWKTPGFVTNTKLAILITWRYPFRPQCGPPPHLNGYAVSAAMCWRSGVNSASYATANVGSSPCGGRRGVGGRGRVAKLTPHFLCFHGFDINNFASTLSVALSSTQVIWLTRHFQIFTILLGYVFPLRKFLQRFRLVLFAAVTNVTTKHRLTAPYQTEKKKRPSCPNCGRSVVSCQCGLCQSNPGQ